MKSSSTLRSLLLIAGVSLLIGGAAALLVGALALSSGQQRPALSVVAGTSVELPASSGMFGGKVMVYTSGPMDSGPAELGCQLVEADGDIAQSTRMSFLDHALGDPVSVDGVAWYPFTEVELASSAATLECRGNTLARAATSTPSVFGGLTSGIGAFAVGTGVLMLALGAAALVARRLTRR